MEEEDEEAAISLPSLQPELLVLIFHKLPIRNVLRCKIVCKEWLSLISDPLFKSTYNTNNHSLSLVLFPKYINVPALSYEIKGSHQLVGKPWSLPCNLDNPALVRVMGSYNGLVALYKRLSFHSFWLFNPSTKEEKLVSFLPTDKLDRSLTTCLTLSGTTGLSHDPATNEYKIVVFDRSVSLYHSLSVTFKDDDDDDNWKMVTKSTPELIKEFSSPVACHLGTTVQGVIHWLYYDYRNWKGSILYLDGRTDEYGMVCLPMGVQTMGFSFDDNAGNHVRIEAMPAPACGLGALDGKLTVALETVGGGKQLRREVWALTEYGNEDSWTLLFVMWVDKSGPFRILSSRKDEWVVFVFDDDHMCSGEKQGLLVYDVGMRCTRPLQLNENWGSSRSSYGKENMVTYSPTLLSPSS